MQLVTLGGHPGSKAVENGGRGRTLRAMASTKALGVGSTRVGSEGWAKGTGRRWKDTQLVEDVGSITPAIPKAQPVGPKHQPGRLLSPWPG